MRLPTRLLMFGFLACLVFPVGAASQTGGVSLEQTIRTTMSTGLWEGFTDKQWMRSGDAVAVAVTKVVGGSQLTNDQIRMLVDMLKISFDAPGRIASAPDREPKTTLFVLRYLALAATDPSLRASIAKTEDYVVRQAEKVSEKQK